MYFHHSQNQNSTSSAAGKHHDGPGPSGLAAGWGRHTFTPAMPLPSPGGFPNGGGGGGFGPPPGHHGHPHHPSFGAGALHMGAQNSGGMGLGHAQGGGFGMGIFGGGSPPRNGAESQMPMTPLWQQQVIKAEACRQNNAPHHRARSAAVTSRSANKAAITIADPNRPASSASNVNGVHKKNLSVVSTADRSNTPDFGNEGAKPPAISRADPANPAQAPVPTKDETPWEQWSGLDLGGIRIKNLSAAMFSFTHLTSLYINHNTLSSIPAAISNLRQLTLLDATGNELTSIPSEIGVLHRLKELLLFDNHLTTLPAELGTLYKLEMLGVEGNPLEDRYRKILAEDGTEALIHHLRDNCPPPAAPPERQWIEIEPDISSPSTGKQESFTVLTYNILCDSFAPQSSYHYTASWALDWSYRKQTILQEIVNASADIVCMQEIDVGQYRDFFYPQLKANGYDGCHYARTRARTMAGKEADLVDGCATFWKDDRFSLVETQVIEFNRLAMQKEHMRTDDMFNRVASRDNIAVVASLEFIASGARLLAVNSHIYWDHQFRDVKIVQIGMLMEELEQIAERFSKLPPKPSIDADFNQGRGPPKYDHALKGTDIPMILCVDLNSLADSAVYDYITNGEIAADHEDFMSHTYGDYTRRGLQHRLGLRSACASFGEMKMTNFTPTFVAAIDYIFYSPNALKVTSVLGDVDKGYLDKTVGFPNAHFPSDHIPIFAQFRVKGQSDPLPPRARINQGY